MRYLLPAEASAPKPDEVARGHCWGGMGRQAELINEIEGLAVLEWGAHAPELGHLVLDRRHRNGPQPAPDAGPRFEYRDGLRRVASRETVGGEGPCHAGSDDDDVDALALCRSPAPTAKEQPCADAEGTGGRTGETKIDAVDAVLVRSSPLSAGDETGA